MNVKALLIYLGKLIVCSFVFIAGVIGGGLIAGELGLSSPVLADGMDAARSSQTFMLLSPLFALALALLARGLAGRNLARWAALSLFAWVTYSLNNAVEGAIFSSMGVAGAQTVIVVFLPATLLCAGAVAWLFPARPAATSWTATVRAFFSSRSAGSWAWRLALSAVCFAPVYWLFGLLVTPFTLDYYREGLFGLRLPSVEVLLPVLLLRSTLFMLACLPIIAGWQLTGKSLFWRLGFALFVMVGFINMLAATYMPLSVRVPHTLEILADSFVHAGLLVLLLTFRSVGEARRSKSEAVAAG